MTAEEQPQLENQSQTNLNKTINAEDLIEKLPDDIDLEQLDKVIEDEDPTFTNSMKDLGADKLLSATEESEEDEKEAFLLEKELWKSGKTWKQNILNKAPFLVFIFFKLKRIKRKIHDAIFYSFKIWLINFLQLLKIFAKKGWKIFVLKLKNAIQSFKNLSVLQKVVLTVSFLGLFAVGYLLKLSLTKGFLPKESPLYLQSFEEKADQVFSITDSTPEAFYDNLRGAGNTIFIQKIVVNLKVIDNLVHKNPMGAFDFYIQGITPEVAVEIKDRESVIRDRMQRVAEEFSFEQLDSVSGKKELTEKLKIEINNLLTTGRIKRIYIKTIILKP